MVPAKKSIISLSIVVLLMTLTTVTESTRYTQISFIDSAIKNFLSDEANLWSKIYAPTDRQQSQNVTLTEILDYFQRNLNASNVANLDLVRTINFQLAEHIRYVNDTQQGAIQLLNERKNSISEQYCEDIIKRLPNEISQIFEITKSSAFLNYVRENSDFCQTNSRIVSPGGEILNLQNVVMDFYTAVPESLIKGYMTVQMAYLVMAIKTSKPAKNQTTSTNIKAYENKSVELREWFKSSHLNLQKNVLSIIKNFTGEIWNCDDFSKPFSFAEITNFMQGYIDNEVNFNRDGSCSGTCSDYRLVTHHTCRNSTICNINFLDKNKTRCDGTIRSCSFIESDMYVCPNENDQYPSRRYHFVRYSSGLTLGRAQFCPEQIKAKSWIRWFVSCSYCFCYCDNDGPLSDRYFSLREATSDINKNKVVTGIRLMKKDRMIHIFVAERQLDSQGKISVLPSEEPWQGDYNFVIEDSGVEAGRDYHKLTWIDRAIELDTIQAPKGEVVTGARFRVVNNRIRFEIRTTPFNYETGFLSRERIKSVWRGNNDHSKEQIHIDGADVPTRSPEKSKRHKEINKFIEFTPSDVYKDIAQSTVPFIDTQAVEAAIPKPLSGAGIYYKSTPGYGGFIGPLLILYDVDDNDSL